MNVLPVIKILKAELSASPRLPRTPEPFAVMDGVQQAEEYNLDSTIDGALFPIYLFHLPRIAQMLKSGDRVLELGCGNAKILTILASLYPDVQFTGLDLSTEMLKHAYNNVVQLEKENGVKIQNLNFKEGSMLELSKKTETYDVIISNFAVHHLPQQENLITLFQGIKEVLKPNGAIYISDLLRPKSIETINKLVKYSYNDSRPFLMEDYYNSLHAAFSVREIKEALAVVGLPGKFNKTKLFEYLFVFSTATKKQSPQKAFTYVRKTRKKLSQKGLIDYWTLRLFF